MPELLLELQDDVHTQAFLQHVTKAQQQGDIPHFPCTECIQATSNIKPHILFINYSNHLFTRVTNTQFYRFVSNECFLEEFDLSVRQKV